MIESQSNLKNLDLKKKKKTVLCCKTMTNNIIYPFPPSQLHVVKCIINPNAKNRKTIPLSTQCQGLNLNETNL